MPKVNPHKNPDVGNLFRWLTVVILLVGGVFIYLIRKNSLPIDASWQTQRVVFGMIIALGVTWISATAKLWMKH